jgi:hypothetical protein
MKYKMSPLLMLILVSFIFFSCSKDSDESYYQQETNYAQNQQQSQQNYCTLETARAIGNLYLLSMPLMDHEDLVTFVQQNKSSLTEGSNIIQCMQKAGSRLTGAGINAYNPADYNKVHGRVLEMGGTADMAQDIASSMERPAMQALAMGQELLWLAKVIPEAANGNWDPYNNTGTLLRQGMIEEIRLFKMQMSYLDPSVDEFFQQFLKVNQEEMVNQITYYIIMFGR